MPVARSTSAASAAKRARTTSPSSGWSPAGPNTRGKNVGLDLADGDVGVGHGERAAAPVRGRPGIGAGAVRPDPEARAVEAEDRAAAGGDGVDRHHRRAHPHAGDLGLEGALELAGVVADVGRGAAHVEADDADRALRCPPSVAGLGTPARRARAVAHHADDAARRPGEDRVLALERLGIGEAARRLHEVEVHARHLGGDGVDVAAQDRREVGVDHGRVAAAHQLHQRAHLVRHAHLGEAGRARQPLGGELVRGEAPAVHEDDRHARQARGARRLQLGGQRRLVERPHQRAVGADPLVGLHHPARRAARAGRCAARTASAAPGSRCAAHRESRLVDDQQRRLALALEQGVGRDRRAHLDALDPVGRDRLVRAEAEQAADAGDGRVAVLLRVLREQLQRRQRAVGALADDVGEGAAAVDPELPAGGSRVGGHRASAGKREAIRVVMSCTGSPVAARTASA